MSDLLSTRGNTSGRAIEPTSASNAAERWLAPVRDAIGSRVVSASPGMTDGGQQQSPGRYLELPREPLVSRGQGIGALIPSVGSSALPQRKYEGNDPFSVLADIFSSVFAGDNATQGETQFSVVPQTVSSGGGNSLLIVAVLGLAGIGIWWFYFRKGGE